VFETLTRRYNIKAAVRVRQVLTSTHNVYTRARTKIYTRVIAIREELTDRSVDVQATNF
jgi:hypothetical protein